MTRAMAPGAHDDYYDPAPPPEPTRDDRRWRRDTTHRDRCLAAGEGFRRHDAGLPQLTRAGERAFVRRLRAERRAKAARAASASRPAPRAREARPATRSAPKATIRGTDARDGPAPPRARQDRPAAAGGRP